MGFIITDYNRDSAVRYAHQWAHARNPAYYNYERIGGDCTNFVSQCVFAGSRVMNYGGTGWYYINGNKKSPSWTGVNFFRNFVVGNSGGPGPVAAEAGSGDMMPGDIIQLSFEGKTFQHSVIVVQTGDVPSDSNIFTASHTDDTDYKLLQSYNYARIRYLHILYVRRWVKD